MRKTIFSIVIVCLNLAVLFDLALIMYFAYYHGFVIRLNINTIGEAGIEVVLLSVLIPILVIGQILMLKWIDKGESTVKRLRQIDKHKSKIVFKDED